MTNDLNKKNFFISIEGIEGVGKTTALKLIQRLLFDAKQEVVLTREPGGTFIAENIRQLLLNTHDQEIIYPETELLLMFAARNQHIQTIIQPALNKGKWVVSDRYVDASFAYQGYGRQISSSIIQTLSNWIVGHTVPDVTILLDAPAKFGMKKAHHRGELDRIEKEKIDFFERVREGYLKRAEEFPKRFHVIDATQSYEIIDTMITQIIIHLLENKHA